MCVDVSLSVVWAALLAGYVCSLCTLFVALHCTVHPAAAVFWTSGLIDSYLVFGAYVYAIAGVTFSYTTFS